MTYHYDHSKKKLYHPVVHLPRRDDLLLDKDTFQRMWVLRKHIADMNSEEAINLLLKNMKGTKDNAEFLTSMNG